ncbi:MAG: rod shape-determining protein MreC [Chloroflexi bacterium]|nr:rod shape-determining protein MreC [Ardenticatenaceae bacterium]MBL1130336.1 rod shape-determining protein MreC [Chloroflexota bacterium]NOG36427.1 rod shape-determining protein MreC [Chloroflexota bacterium]GIK57809.1 MAG: cell shape-determining protein MreC [Chloroflexota bacterium]
MSEAQKRIRWGTFAVLAGVALLLTYLDSTGNLGGALAVVRNPFTAVLSFTSTRSESAAGLLEGPRDLQTARTEIAELQARVAELERENEELREIEGEWRILQDLFNRARQSPEFTRQIASVIGHDTSPSIRSIIIDKGTADGIRVGMPVESSRGLVGIIYRAAPNFSQVTLITDNASAIPARLGNSRATGILSGGGLGGPLTMDWVDLKYNLEIGEVVLTSGLGGSFPQDIVVGRVIEVNRSEANLFQQAVVQPATDFENLEIVFVITNFQPVNTAIFDNP